MNFKILEGIAQAPKVKLEKSPSNHVLSFRLARRRYLLSIQLKTDYNSWKKPWDLVEKLPQRKWDTFRL